MTSTRMDHVVCEKPCPLEYQVVQETSRTERQCWKAIQYLARELLQMRAAAKSSTHCTHCEGAWLFTLLFLWSGTERPCAAATPSDAPSLASLLTGDLRRRGRAVASVGTTENLLACELGSQFYAAVPWRAVIGRGEEGTALPTTAFVPPHAPRCRGTEGAQS